MSVDRLPGVLTLPKTELLIYPDGRQRVVEVAQNKEMGMSAVSAQWGFAHTEAEWNAQLGLYAEQDSLAADAIKVKGFQTVYQSFALPNNPLERNLSTESLIALEIEIARIVILRLLENNHLDPRQIDFITLGTGSPLSGNYALDFAHSMGLSHLDYDMTFEVNAACNSGGQALWEALTRPEFQGKLGIVFGSEGWTRLLNGAGQLLKQADPLSLKTFADGMAAMIVQPGVTHRVVTHFPLQAHFPLNGGDVGISKFPYVVPDKRHALDGQVPYQKYLNGQDPWLQTVGRKMMINLNPSRTRSQIEMNGELTARGFLEPLFPLAEAVWLQFLAENPGAHLAAIIPHHASPGVNGVAERKVVRRGMVESMPFVLDGGNSSSSTMLRAYVRLMENYKPGDFVMFLSFGAGMSFTVFIVELGKLNPSLIRTVNN